jgi:hypothetical protein
MRLNFNPLIKSCGTRTVPSPGTDSILLRADAQGVMVFANPSWQLHHDQRTFVHLSGLGTVKTNYRDPWLFYHLPRLAKTTPPRRGLQLIKPPGCNNSDHHGRLPACPTIGLRLYPDSLINSWLIRNVWQICLIWTGRKQAFTSGKLV